MPQPPLTAPLRIGDVAIANRVVLAPLAGIGNWFVRLQARRHGAGLVVSEMVSSFGVHHRNARTVRELLRVHPGEHPVSIQLFGHDPEVMRSAAASAVAAGADLIDINMGCPVRKVVKTGSGAALIRSPDLAVRLAVAAGEGAGRPVTVKLRSGLEPEDRAGLRLAVRLVEEAGVAAIALHPRSAAVQHRGRPDYPLVAELSRLIGGSGARVIVSGGLASAADARRAYVESNADAVMIARGALGNPWIFGELAGRRTGSPGTAEIASELAWTMDRAAEHLGPERAARYLRKFYPWYLERLGVRGRGADALQRAGTLAEARGLLASLAEPLAMVA